MPSSYWFNPNTPGSAARVKAAAEKKAKLMSFGMSEAQAEEYANTVDMESGELNNNAPNVADPMSYWKYMGVTPSATAKNLMSSPFSGGTPTIWNSTVAGEGNNLPSASNNPSAQQNNGLQLRAAQTSDPLPSYWSRPSPGVQNRAPTSGVNWENPSSGYGGLGQLLQMLQQQQPIYGFGQQQPIYGFGQQQPNQGLMDDTHGMYRPQQTNWGGGYGSRQGMFNAGPLSQMFNSGWRR